MALPFKIVGVAETVKFLNTIDKDIVKEARRDLRSGAMPVANAIKSNIPSEAPLRGMVHNGRTGWRSAGVTARVKTNFTKKAEVRGTSLVSIVVGGKTTGAAAFQIADMAGKKRRGKTASGKAMITKLNAERRASRYAWPAAEREIPYIRNEIEDTIKKLERAYNERLKKGR
jgi:gas vesicle protein